MGTKRRSITVAAAVLLGLAAAAPAYAGTAAAPPAQGAGGCNLNLDTGAVRCFDSFQEAIVHATGGLIADAPADARTAAASTEFAARMNALTEADGSPAAAVASVPISTFWQHPDEGGEFWNVTGNSGCGNGTTIAYRISDIDNYDTWWDDRISSSQGWNACEPNLYEDPNYAGAQTGWHSRRMHLGAMEDQASSIRWR
ncbi:hypothetical protein [Allonocardiopsis opalescens]|uniref:Peptidase inhibitor family I36 n=1 Tax=Allonocardiopsis opalescens TaxID=1144618 RepID=A0A2T0Q1W3_9ACTN|nr:hypothetical protein [Allonocardiopsis opalescens]PRX97700.1 hypothetical protein CLV72_10550 [Allonocardiopsis opalescens]